MKIEIGKEKFGFYLCLIFFLIMIPAELWQFHSWQVDLHEPFYILTFVFEAVFFPYILLMLSASYTLDSDGFHLHFFFFTFNYSWDSFSDIYIARTRYNTRSMCFSRGLKHSHPRFSYLIPPFRYFVITLEEGIKPVDRSVYGRVVKRAEIIRFLKNNHLPYTIRDY